MIRDYVPGDLDAVVTMVRRGDMMSPGNIRERVEQWPTLVLEEEGVVKGLTCCQKESDGEFDLRVFVDPLARHAGVGNALYKAAIPRVAQFGNGRLTVGYRLDLDDAQRFYRDRGFVYWYSMDMLRYEGAKIPNATLPDRVEIRLYEDKDFEDFISVMGDSFIPQRRFFDFRPHDVSTFYGTPGRREQMLKGKENLFVLTDSGKIAAIAELEGNFIDTLGVNLADRGRGFGKLLMQHCINILLDRGHSAVETSVVLGNLPAWRLYNVLGFKRVQINEWACKWI